MKYQINIAGMHCQGCASLIKLSLEDEGLKNVNVDLKTESGTFNSADKEEAAKTTVERAFSGLPGYTFQNFKTLA